MPTPPPLFSTTTGLLIIAGYGAAAFALTWATSRHEKTGKAAFLLANRKLGVWPLAFSIAATWIWAPALFLASEKAFTQGFTGVFWFTVPNVLCLIIFAYFADRIRSLAPNGFTLSGYMRDRHSPRVQTLYLLQLCGLAACSFAVQLLAGGKVLAYLTGLPFLWVTILMAAIALSYSLFSGLKASVMTDYAQMIIILAVVLGIVPWAVHEAGGLAAISAGLGGADGGYGVPWRGDGFTTSWTFGIPVTLGLLAGPFGDQSFWQRAFAAETDTVKPAFIRGALLFAVVPVALSLLGFIAAGKGWQLEDTALVNLESIRRLLPAWVMIPMVFMLLSGLISTLDSNLCAVASLWGHDIERMRQDTETENDAQVVGAARISMLALAAAALLIANLPGIKILYLFLFYGTLRASTLLPTMFTLTRRQISERAVFYGILAGIAMGLPVFAYGNFCGHPVWKTTGAVLTVALSGIAVLAGSRRASAADTTGNMPHSADPDVG